MAPIRTILAALIAISVALVPAKGEAVVSAKPIEMSMPNSADMPCCATDDCKGSIACALKCFNIVGAMFPFAVVFLRVVDWSPPSFANGILHGHVSPPIHPPPI